MKTMIPSACICATILTGCARFDPLRGFAGSYRSYTEIKGDIKDGHYTSPQTNFSCKIPALLRPGAVIKDHIDKKEGTGVVVFADDFGLKLAVHWFSVSAQGNLVSDSVLLERIAAIIEETDKKTLPKVTIGTKARDVADQSALFYMAIGEAPGVKIYIPPDQRKTLTKEMVMPRVFRGHLIFRRGNWVYLLTTQTESEFGANKVRTAEQQEAKVKANLQKLLADIKFN